MLPETQSFIERQKVRANSPSIGSTFVKEGKVALKRHWILLIYLVLLMAGFNFMVRNDFFLQLGKMTDIHTVSRLSGSLPDHAEEPVQLQPQRCDCNSSCCQSGRNDWRHCHRLLLTDLRSPFQHHCHFHSRRCFDISLQLYWQ